MWSSSRRTTPMVVPSSPSGTGNSNSNSNSSHAMTSRHNHNSNNNGNNSSNSATAVAAAASTTAARTTTTVTPGGTTLPILVDNQARPTSSAGKKKTFVTTTATPSSPIKSTKRSPPRKKISSSSSSSKMVPSGSTSIMNQQHHLTLSNNKKEDATTISTTTSPKNVLLLKSFPFSNVMQWIQGGACPPDVVPHIVSFLHPQRQWPILRRINQFWAHMLAPTNDATWQCLSEATYKWKEGDAIPSSWFDFYCNNPCVPVDYSSIEAALSSSRDEVKVWLRPARYVLKQAITMDNTTDESSLVHPSKISLVTMQLPWNVYRSPGWNGTSMTMTTTIPASATTTTTTTRLSLSTATTTRLSPSRRLAQRARQVRNRILCRSATADDTIPDTADAAAAADDNASMASLDDEHSPDYSTLQQHQQQMAVLVLKSRRHNEPLLRIRHGQVTLEHVVLQHNALGMDIWNGNAAIQIQPPPMTTPPATATAADRPVCVLHGVTVSSKSGRGIVNIDGGHLVVSKCMVYDCAATGIYVGGPGSTAVVTDTDVVFNGGGNKVRRGVARGHSGIYLEQGKAVVQNCNISRNSLTGISAVSVDHAILELTESDLIANGTNQLEMPPNAIMGGGGGRGGNDGRTNTMRREDVAMQLFRSNTIRGHAGTTPLGPTLLRQRSGLMTTISSLTHSIVAAAATAATNVE